MSFSSEVDPSRKTGSVQYVALSDIKSGKVKLPNPAEEKEEEVESKGSRRSSVAGKGFAPPSPPIGNHSGETMELQ